MAKMAYRDPNDAGNSSAYHTGKPCIEKGCSNPAGTYWSEFWCQEHNAERLERITKNLEDEIAYRRGKASAT